MVSAVDDTGVTSTFSGRVNMVSANCCISLGMVAEKEQRLPFLRHFSYDLFYIVHKTHIQHTVGFIQHQHFNVLK